MTANRVFLQTLADITGLAVERPADLEMTARGAARAAAIALGWLSGPGDRADPGPAAARFEPGCGADDRAARRGAWDRAVRAAIGMADG